jgi:outer membrane autotransporter protein
MAGTHVMTRAAVALLVALGLAVAPNSAAEAQTFQKAMADALDNQCLGLSGPSGTYDSRLDSICTSIPTGPSVSSGSALASITLRQSSADERRILGHLQEERLAQRDGGVRAASADQTARAGRLGFFLTGEFEFIEKDITNYSAGFKSNSLGVILGADYQVLPWITVGIALAYSHVEGNFSQDGGHYNTDNFGATLYASFLPIPNFFVDATIGYAHHEYDTLRRATYVGPGIAVDGFAQSDTRGNEFRMAVLSGYDFVMKALTVGPRFGVNYSTLAINSFTERGQDGINYDTGLELAYYPQNRDSLTTNLGAFLSYAISTPIGVLVPQFTAEWVHEFLDDQRAVYFRFRQDAQNTKLRFQTDTPDRDYFNLGVGVVLALPKDVAVFANYRAMVGHSDTQTHTVSAGVRVQF